MVVGLHLPGLQALYLPSFKTKGRAWSWQRQKHQRSNPGVPSLFGSRDQFYRKQFFHRLRGWQMVWGWFKHFIVHFISIIILPLHLRSSGIRPQRSGTPCSVDRGSYISEARSWSNTARCATSGQNMVAVHAPRRGEGTIYGVISVRWLIGYPKLAKGHVSHGPFD